MAKKRTFKEFKQGIFRPKNKAKCVNKEPPFYRSALEMKFMLQLDKNASIIQWGSETYIVPYYKESEGRPRYFVDFWVKKKMSDGTIRELLIEVKPSSQIIPPKSHGNKKPSTLQYESIQFSNNNCKWNAAIAWCDKGKIS